MKCGKNIIVACWANESTDVGGGEGPKTRIRFLTKIKVANWPKC